MIVPTAPAAIPQSSGFRLSLQPPTLGGSVLPGQLSVLPRLGDDRLGLAVGSSPQLLGSAGGCRLDAGPLHLGLRQDLPSLLLKLAGLLGGCLELVSGLHAGRHDRGLDPSAGLSQHPSSDHPAC